MPGGRSDGRLQGGIGSEREGWGGWEGGGIEDERRGKGCLAARRLERSSKLRMDLKRNMQEAMDRLIEQKRKEKIAVDAEK